MCEPDKLTDALGRAVEDGQNDRVEELLFQGADPNRFLHETLNLKADACLRMITTLLNDRRCNINLQNREGETLLLRVCSSSQRRAVVLLLLSRGADPNIMSNDGYVPLHAAVVHQSLDVIDSLMRYGANVILPKHISEPDKRDWRLPTPITPLMNHVVSIIAGDEQTSKAIPVLERLLAAGADVNELSVLGESALYQAVEDGKEKIIEFLLKNGADPNLLLERQPLLKFCMNRDHYQNRLTIADLLLAHGANPNARQSERTVLGIAIRACPDNTNFLEKLLAHGGDVRTPERKGGPSMLDIAVKDGGGYAGTIINLLFRFGANPRQCVQYDSDTISKGYLSPLITSCVRYSDGRITRLLLERGADPNSHLDTDEGRMNALCEAVRKGSTMSARALVEFGAYVNVLDQEGESALHIAVRNRDLGVVRLLLDYGADPCTVRHSGPLEVVKLLVERGGSVKGCLEYANDPAVKAYLEAQANAAV